MDKSVIGQSELEYSNQVGSGLLNIVTSRFLYNIPLMTIGMNNYEMGVSLICNSALNQTDNLDNTISYKNWKVNICEYLLPYNPTYSLDNFIEGDYVYIDSLFRIHCFRQLNSNNIYYDTSNASTKMYKELNNTSKIIDNTGNVIEFNNTTISSFQSGINPNIKKIVTYYNGKIESIYDERKSERKIKFDYLDDKLISITNTCNDITIKLVYNDNNELIKIRKVKNDYSSYHDIVCFKYSDNKLEYIVNPKTLDTLKLTYEDNKVTKIEQGFSVKSKITEDSSQAFLGDIYLNEDIYLTSSVKRIKGYNYSLNDIETSNTFTYSTNYTDVVDKNKKTIRYYLNSNLQTTSMFYKESDNVFVPIERKEGWSLDSIVDTLKKSNSYSYSMPSNMIYNFYNSFSDKNEEINYFIFECLLKTNFDITSNLYLSIDLQLGRGTFNNKMFIQRCQSDTWQKVSIPINLGVEVEQIDSFVLSILGMESNTLNEEVSISNVRIKKGAWQDIYIDSTKLDYNSEIYYKKVNEAGVINGISSDFYMTQSDIFNTYKNIYLKTINNESEFALVYCNSSKVMLVESVGIIIPNSEPLSVDYFSINNLGLANYLIKTTTGLVTHVYTVTDNTLSFNYDSTLNKYYYEIKNVHRASNSSDSIDYYEQVYFDGLKKETKDQYNVRTVYQYDGYGNYISTEIIDSEDNENLISSCTYKEPQESQETKERLREFIATYEENSITTTYCFNEEYFNLEYVINGRQKIEYQTDPLTNELKKVEFIDNESLLYTSFNDIIYDIHGNIKAFEYVNGTTQISYGFTYTNGVLDEVYRNNVLISKNTISNTTTGKTFTKKNYLTANSPKTTINNYDIYNRLLTSNLENNIVSFEYETNNVSLYDARVTKITDPYANSTYDYSYDDINNSVECVVTENNCLIQKTRYKGNTFQYHLNDKNEDFINTTVIVDDKTKVSINKKKLNTSTNLLKLTDEFDTINEFCFDYEYDKFNRIKSKKGHLTNRVNTTYNSTNIYMDKTYSYIPSSLFINNLTYSLHGDYLDLTPDRPLVLDSANITYQCTYDTIGNIISINESGKRYTDNPVNSTKLDKVSLPSRDYQYTYDTFNRLIKEKIYNNDTLQKTYEYEYSLDGSLSKVKENDIVIKEFVNEKGLLKQVIKGNKTIKV